ncbi:hypothetical protein B0H16DRAFT_1896591 [Mycena metata]|uniref:Ribonuclease H1 N-terminal domain-containing protein n=1 Tax=Mycena metata TaxID=1033252 RepID=A0AAD7HI45_9AGAR|nr:hypothetical protein B0H16DRAFT_1896591 [Mycena metata]
MSTDRDASPDYDDSDLINLIANLDLSTIDPAPAPPQLLHVSDRLCRRINILFPPFRPAVFALSKPFTTLNRPPAVVILRIGLSTAGSVTQAVPNTCVHAVQRLGPKKKKKNGKKATYIVFCGHTCGVFGTWEETSPLVTGVPNTIFCGYPTLSQAEAAYAYADSRSWIRVADRPMASGIAWLPQPINIQQTLNALNNNTEFDDKWYIVYRGITPGVYRSHLESQLNTVGVRSALHESMKTFSAAMKKYTKATSRGETMVAPPPRYDDVFS